MKIKAELIQASNNLATSTALYTFRLTYPRKSWLDIIGLSKYFEKRLTTTVISTHTNVYMLLYCAEKFASRTTYVALHEQVCEIVAFAEKIFKATNPNNYGAAKRITAADINKAIALFGHRLQEVLKQYKPGEMHMPFGVGPNHVYTATEDGWIKSNFVE